MPGGKPRRDHGAERPGTGRQAAAPRHGLAVGAALVFLSAWIHVGSIGGGARPESRQPQDSLCCWSNAAVIGESLAPALQGRFFEPEREGFRNAIRPLPLLFLRMEHSAFAESTAGYRVIQLLLLGVVGVVLFLLLTAWGGSVLSAAFGAMFLVVHPLSVPSVAGIAGVSDLLSLLFLLGGLWAARTGRGVLVSSGLVLLAALCNEMAFAAIPAVGVWAWARNHRRPGLSRGGGAVTAFAMGFGLAGLAVVLYRALVLWTLPQNLKIAQAVEAWTGVGFGRRLLVGLAGVFESCRLIAFPWPIGYANDYLLTSRLTPLRAAAGAVLCVLLALGLVLAVRRASRDRQAPSALVTANRGTQAGDHDGAAWPFWVAMVFFPLLGVSGLFFPTGAILPSRALLFVLPGAAGLMTWGVHWVVRHRRGVVLQVALPVLGVIVLGVAGWRTIVRTGDYRNWAALVARQTIEFPRSAQGWFDQGNIRLTRGEGAAARAAYNETLTLRPDYWEAWINLGVAYYDEEERGLAMRAFTHAVDGTAGNKALRILQARARFHQGLVYLTQVKNVEAARCFEDMLAVFPDHLYSHANLGMLYSNSEALDDRARDHLQRAMQLETNPERRAGLGNYLDDITKRRERSERRRERLSGGVVPGGGSGRQPAVAGRRSLVPLTRPGAARVRPPRSPVVLPAWGRGPVC